MLVRPILVEVLKRDRYRRLRSGGRRDSGVDVSDLHGLGNAPHGCRDADGHHARHAALVNVVRVEHILAVKNDVFPFDGAHMLQETDVDIFAFRNAHFQNAGDFLGLPIDDTGQQ